MKGGLNGIQVEDLGAADSVGRERVEQQRLEHAAQPLVGRDVEAFLLALENSRGQFVFHQLPQDVLLLAAADLEILGQGRSELDDAVVQEGRAHLEPCAMLIRSHL